MSSSIAGPSQPPQISYTPQQSQQSQPQVITNQMDLKRRMEGDSDPSRRTKQARPPLPPPHILASLVPDSPAFVDLMQVEQKLDWTLLRKKAEINDALGRPVRVKRNLRLFISNTAHDQTWQNELSASGVGSSAANPGSPSKQGDVAEVQVQGKEANMDVNTGKGIPGWVMRIEGRLLDTGNNRLDKTKRKFSTFLKSAAVEFDNREHPTFPEGNIVEWQPQTLPSPLDGFEISRRGDQNVSCRIILHMNHYPERFKVVPPLCDLIALNEGTRSEVMSAVWRLVKVVGAQDKEDVTVIRPVGGLGKIIPPGQDGLPFHQLPEIVTRHLTHPDPIVIPYTIKVDQDYLLHPKCYDIPIEMEDPLKSKMANIVASFEGEEGREIVELEDKVGELAFFARDVKQKRDFLESFAADPQKFINKWLAAQARDLDQMLGYQIGNPGVNGGNVREEDLRRSDLFNLPWVQEAITVHETSRMEAERRGGPAR